MKMPDSRSPPIRLVQHTDEPAFSYSTFLERQSLQRAIRGEEEVPESAEEPVVEITGLELLSSSSEHSSTEEEDMEDYSFDSFANDSYTMTQIKVNPVRRAGRRRMLETQRRRASNESQTSRDYSRYMSTRRSSMGSAYALDSVEQGHLPRRSSMGSFQRRSSLGSDLDISGRYPSRYGTHNKAARRFSNCSDYANDSIDVAFQHKGGVSNPRFSRTASSHEIIKRRMSNASATSFSPDVFETQSINTGGVGRAA